MWITEAVGRMTQYSIARLVECRYRAGFKNAREDKLAHVQETIEKNMGTCMDVDKRRFPSGGVPAQP
jgi:hypothetical protein